MDRQPVKVTIFNQTFTLVSQGDPAELVGVAREVDELMHSIAEKTGSTDVNRVAILTCMHLADRLRSIESLETRLTDRAAHFSALLEQVLQNPQS
jgi:cell division protein ZapA